MPIAAIANGRLIAPFACKSYHREGVSFVNERMPAKTLILLAFCVSATRGGRATAATADGGW